MARSRAWRILSSAFAITGSFAPRTAHADLKMYWSCYVVGGNVDCVKLEGSLTSAIPFLRTVSKKSSADVDVSVRSVPDEDGTRYRISLVGKRVAGEAIEVHTNDRIPSFVDEDTATLRVLTKLERGLDDFMGQKDPARAKNGKLTIELTDPAHLPFTGRPEQSGRKWFVAPGLAATFSDVVGVGINATGNATALFNYSERAWRLQQWIGASYTRMSQPVPGTDETADVDFLGFNANDVLTWSFTKDRRWSFGLLFGAEKNPQANYAFRSNVSLGFEFDVRPRETVSERNLGFRCAVGPEAQRYDTTNVEGKRQEVVARELCDAFVSWHFRPIDVFGSIGETVLLQNPDYRAFSVSLSAVWRITDDVTLSPWLTFQQINKAIDEAMPVTAVYSDPRDEIRASMIAGVEQGYTAPFGIQSGLTLRYLFGNGTLDSEDQRWRDVSNLR